MKPSESGNRIEITNRNEIYIDMVSFGSKNSSDYSSFPLISLRYESEILNSKKNC